MMDRGPDKQLKLMFLKLLLKADPSVGKRQVLAEDFAERLAAFSQDWASGAADLDERQRSLRNWVESNAAHVSEASTSSPKSIARYTTATTATPRVRYATATAGQRRAKKR